MLADDTLDVEMTEFERIEAEDSGLSLPELIDVLDDKVKAMVSAVEE